MKKIAYERRFYELVDDIGAYVLSFVSKIDGKFIWSLQGQMNYNLEMQLLLHY